MFSGIGGFRAGLERAGGFTCIGHCEIDKYANMNYQAIHRLKEGEWYCKDARCITAHYAKSSMSMHAAEKSGVFIAPTEKYCNKDAICSNDKTLISFRNIGQFCRFRDCYRKDGDEVYGRIRKLTPRECLRLQGFDEDQIDRVLDIMSDTQAYKQAGNSVTVNIVHALGLRIKKMHEDLMTVQGGF